MNVDVKKVTTIGNFLLKIRRELRATRNERRAEAREARAAEKHEQQQKKYFGRPIN